MIDYPKGEIISDVDRMKNELLNYINAIENKIDMKLSLFETKQETSFNQFKKQVDTMSTQYTSMSETVTEQKVKIGKIEDLEKFKKKGEDQLITHEIRINNLRKEFDRSVEKNDRIYVDNLIVPGYIGECAQYKNMKEYIDYNIDTVSTLVASKEKLTVDLKEYKVKLEGLIALFNSQVEKYNKNQIDYINLKQVEIKEYIAEQMKIINDEFIELRMMNCKYAVDLKAKASELNVEWEKIMQIKKEIYKRYDEKVDEFKATEKKTNLNVFDMKNEFNKIKAKFNELVDFIKDIRFRKNLEKDNFEGIKRKEIKTLAKKIEFTRKNSQSLDLGNGKEVDIDYAYDYFNGDVKSDGETNEKQKSAYNKKEIIEDNNKISSTIYSNTFRAIDNDRRKDENNHHIDYIANNEPGNAEYLQSSNMESNINKQNNDYRPRNLKITINNIKETRNEKSNLSNAIEMKRIITEPKPKSLSPDLSKKRRQNNPDIAGKPEILRVVALNYDHQMQPNSLFKVKEQINASFKPVTISRNDQKKKFKTVKENSQALKISFGASILNAKEGKTNKDSIDCSQKSNSNFVLVNQNMLK